MNKSRSVTLFLPTLASGGAERVTLNLAATLAKADYKVTILVQRRTGKLVGDIPLNVELASLDRGRTLASLLSLKKYLRIAKPEIFIANLGHANIISLWAKALARSPAHMIVCQHSMLSEEARAHKIWQYKILPFLYRLFLPWADAIVTVSKTVAQDLSHCAAIPEDRITTIYNPIIGSDFIKRLEAPQPHAWFGKGMPPVILGIGRLVKEKDFTTLIKAFARARQQKDLRLIILGEGPLHDDLQKLIDDLALTEHVRLAGFQANPLPFIRDAAVVVISSRYEGLSNVLIETLACGTNVISTDCPGGHMEVLDHERFGSLVPVGDVEEMARAILKTIQHPKDAQFLQQRGREFTFERAADQYIQLFGAARS